MVSCRDPFRRRLVMADRLDVLVLVVSVAAVEPAAAVAAVEFPRGVAAAVLAAAVAVVALRRVHHAAAAVALAVLDVPLALR